MPYVWNGVHEHCCMCGVVLDDVRAQCLLACEVNDTLMVCGACWQSLVGRIDSYRLVVIKLC